MKNHRQGFFFNKVLSKALLLHFILGIFFFSASPFAYAQDYSSRGKEFWMGFCKNYGGSGTLTLYISAKKATSGTVSVPMGGFSQAFAVGANSTTSVVVPTGTAMATGPDFIEGKGVHIVSADTISVFALNYQAYTSDASVVLPVQTIGEEYYATAYKDVTWYSGPTEVLIVGANANTLIEVTPTVATLSGKPAGVPFTIVLNPGEVYQLMSDNDLTGTHLKSLPNGGTCGKFAVFGGNECTNVGSCQYCDHLYDQMFPVNTWGKNYITVPLKTRNGDLFRVVASQNGTSFTIDGGAAINLNQGQFYQVNLSTASYIKSNKPISLSQFSRGSVCDGANSDPFYIMMSPTEQMLNYTTFNAFTSSIISQYYLNVVSKSNGLGNIQLDGVPIGGQFASVPSNPLYSYAKIDIAQGNHTMVSDSGFFAYVYGYGSYESYGYSAGVNLNNLFAKFAYSTTSKPACPNTPVTFSGQGDSTILSWEWDFGDGSQTTGANPVHVYSDFGDYNVTLVIQRANSCTKDTLRDKLSMTGPKAFIQGPDTSCFQNTVVLTAIGDTSVKSFLWSTGATTNSISVLPQSTSVYWVQGIGICKGRPDSLTVNVSKPVADFSMSSVCEGKSVNFKSLSTTNISVLSKWKWDFGDGQVSTQANPVHVYASPGVYQVKHVITNKFGCMDSVVKSLQIYALPKANFIGNSACLNKQIAFQDLSTSSVGSITGWSWDFGDGNSSSLASPGHTYGLPSTYQVSLLVTTGFGCRDSITKQVTTYPIPTAAFTSSPVCMNSNSLFSSTSTVGVGSISSLLWSFDDLSSGVNNSSALVSPSHVFTQCGSFQVSLLAISSNFCRDSVTKTYTVHCLPKAAFGTSDVCYSTTSGFKDSSTILIGNIATWSWNFGDGGSSLLQNPGHVFSSCGNFNSRLIVSSTNGCADTAYRLVRVFCTPLASFTANNACSNKQPVSFKNTSTLSSGSITNLDWDLGDGTTSHANTFTHSYLTENNFTVSLIALSDKGCRDTATKLIQIFPTPKSAFSLSGSCLNSNILFTDLSSIGSGGTINSWNWNFGDGNTSLLKNPGHQFGGVKTYTISLEVTSGNGCKDTSYQTLNVNMLPVPAFTANAVCLKSPTIFTNASSIGSGSIVSYSWNFGDSVGISNSSNPNYTYAKAGTYQVKLIAVSSNGCKDSIVKSVVVYPAPISAFSIGAVCQQSNSLFSDSSQMASGYSLTQWKWTFGDGASSSQKNPSHVYALCGSYPVQLTTVSNKGCRDSVVQQAIVHCLPVAGFTVNDVCANNSSLFKDASVSTDGNISQYDWNFGDASAISGFNPSHTYLNCGIYQPQVVVSTVYGCKDTSQHMTTVHCIPQANFAAPSVCLENSTPFTNLSVVASDTLMGIFYSFGDGGNSIQKNPTHTYASCGTFSVQQIAVSGFGCKDTIVHSIAVNCLPQVDFSSDDVCLNVPMLFKDSSTISVGLLSSWKWEFGDGGISVLKSPAHTYQSCGTYPVRLILTSNFSCKDTLNKLVDVYCLPHADFAVGAVCQGNQNQFADASTISSGTIVSQNWNFSEPSSAFNTSTQQNPEHTYDTCGNYAVRLTVITDHLCRDSIQKAAVVHCLPVSDFQSNGVCLNDTSRFVNLSKVASSVISQSRWVFDDVVSGAKDTSTLMSPSHVYPSCGIYQVQLISMSNYACSDTLVKTAEVYCLPQAGILGSSVCLSHASLFRDSSFISNGNIQSWGWDFGDGIGKSIVENPVYTYQAAGVYDVGLIVFSDHMCVDTIHQSYQVYAIPIPNFSTQDACFGMPVQFIDSSMVAGGDFIQVWNWNFGNASGTSSLKNPLYTYPSEGIYQVHLQVESNHQCADSMVKPIEIFPIPQVNFGDSSTGCRPLEVDFKDFSTITKGVVSSWYWDFGDGNFSDIQQPTHIYNSDIKAPMHYGVKLTLTSDQGCKNELYKPGFVTLNPLPEAAFDINPTSISILAPQVEFSDQTLGNGKLIRWDWDFGDMSGSTEIDPVHLYQESGTYRIRLAVMNQYFCKDTVFKIIEVKPEFTFFIPNAFTPDDDGVNDVFMGAGIGIAEYSMDIFDRWGNHIFNTTQIEKGWDGKVEGAKEVSQQDVYVYLVKLTDIFGQLHRYIGRVNLVR